jgi:hypothetical protein
VLELLKTTTRAIRSTRNYLVSLPDESALSPVFTRAHFRSMALGPAPSRRGGGGGGGQGHGHGHDVGARTPPDKGGDDRVLERQRPKKGRGDEPAALVRKSALEVLAALRDVEERYRLPLSDEAYDAQSDGARVTSPDVGLGVVVDHELDARHHDHDGDLSITYSLIQIQVGDRVEEVPVWENEESDSDVEEEKKTKRELWDERLVLGSGWLYRQDVRMEDMAREREVVKGHLDLVDKVIFGAARDGEERDEEREVRRLERGWERERRRVMRPRSRGRRVSTGDGERRSMGTALVDSQRRVSVGAVEVLRGMSLTEEPEEMEDCIPEGEEDEDEGVHDEDLPDWAKRSKFVGDNLGEWFLLP